MGILDFQFISAQQFQKFFGVGNDNHAVLFGGEGLDDLRQRGDGGAVGAEGRFVENDPGWEAGDGGGEGDALADGEGERQWIDG